MFSANAAFPYEREIRGFALLSCMDLCACEIMNRISDLTNLKNKNCWHFWLSERPKQFLRFSFLGPCGFRFIPMLICRKKTLLSFSLKNRLWEGRSSFWKKKCLVLPGILKFNNKKKHEFNFCQATRLRFDHDRTLMGYWLSTTE